MVKLYCKILSDLIVYVILTAFTFLLVFDKISSIRPFVRGFYCDDQDLQHPIVEETISDGAIIAMAFLVFPVFVIVVEIFYAANSGSSSDIRGTLWVYVKNLYRTIGAYLYGGSATILVVECLKIFVGRLRPNFFAACKLNHTTIDCSSGFITNYTCGEPDEEVVADLRKSFPSGHSATAAYGMLYLIVYLQFRMLLKWVRLLRPLVQTAAVILGVFICASRLQDYRHHPGDVIGGAIVGALGCLLTVIFLSDKMNYMNKAYILRQQKKNEENMEKGTFKGIDNAGFRDSVFQLNMAETSLDQNGRKRQSSSGNALP